MREQKIIDVVDYCKNRCRCNSEYCDKASCPIWNAPSIEPERLPIVKELQELRAEFAKEHEQLRRAKNCVAGLSMLLKAVDGKMVMDMVRPIAEKRLNQYRDEYPLANVVMESEVKGMEKYSYVRPEWADEEDCPFETGEVKDCMECYWGKAEEEG